VVGLRQRGVQVRKGETTVVDEFNKVQYFNQCVCNQGEQTHNFHVGRLRVEKMLLVLVVTKIIMPRGSNHATLNGGDLVVMYCIQNGVVVDWTYTICDHMLKAKRLTDFKFPYVVLIFKVIEHFGVDVEGELEESIGLLNHVSPLDMHKMRFTKIGNTWLVEGEQVANMKLDSMAMKLKLVDQTKKKMIHKPWPLRSINLLRTLDLYIPSLRGWFLTNFKT